MSIYIKQFVVLMIGIIIVTLLSGVCNAVTIKEYNITENDLPYTFTEDFDFLLQPNATLYFSPINNSQYINLNYPSSYTFGENETNYTLNVLGLIGDFYIGENTTIYEGFNISTSLNNITNNVLFKFNIENVPINETIIENNSEVYEVSIIDDGFNVTISSNTLPKTGILDFEITGYPNQNGTVSYCGDFLNCPSSFTFDNNGEATLSVAYTIPYGQAVGTYSRVIAIQSNGTFRQSKVFFNIIEPQYVIKYYVYEDDCFTSKSSMIECVREQQEYDSARLTELINELMKEDTSICPTVNETIKYVMQGEINNSLLMLYNSAIKNLNSSRAEIQILRDENKELKLENSELMAEKDVIQTDANTLVKEAQDEAFSVKVNSEKQIEEEKQSTDDRLSFWFWFAFWVVLIGGAFSYVIYSYTKDNWIKLK